MIEVRHFLTTGTRFIENIADKMSAAYKEKTIFKGNSLIFPDSLAKGKFEFYNIELGLGVCLSDCQFFESIKFKREAIEFGNLYVCHFNLSTIPVLASKQSGEIVDLGTDWKDSVLFSTSAEGVEVTPTLKENFRIVLLIFTREWLLRHYDVENISSDIAYAHELKNDLPLQFTIDLDLPMLHITQEMLVSAPPAHMKRLYYEGCAKRLIGLVMNRLSIPVTSEERLKFKEVSQVMMIRERIEQAIDKPLPQLDDLAAECNMSKSKFSTMFKAIYQKNYLDFFMEIKMQKAALLLLKGSAISEVGQSLGYHNIGHFSIAFKEYFKVTPKVYQSQVNRSRNDGIADNSMDHVNIS